MFRMLYPMTHLDQPCDQPTRLIIADDDADALENLESSGLAVDLMDVSPTQQIKTVRNGADAISLIQSSGPRSIVITDLRMPSADGFGVVRAARQRGINRVLIRTSSLQRGQNELPATIKETPIVDKSISLQDMLSIIQRLFRDTVLAVINNPRQAGEIERTLKTKGAMPSEKLLAVTETTSEGLRLIEQFHRDICAVLTDSASADEIIKQAQRVGIPQIGVISENTPAHRMAIRVPEGLRDFLSPTRVIQ